ncbi:putative clathrin assembly protein At4g40080 [Corylus avellana]|uniref:putative clathrin assembly protein At4g40080 n=1 Tax=Corylus avellana TaxID=13451 RepID=UPI001E231E92|nr:putative clathrin assembly protein At4g40080 [Corylus avellana]
MGRLMKLRNLIDLFKDKASLIKATLSIKRVAGSINVAVLRATTHDSSGPPTEKHVGAVLALGNGSRVTASLCIEAIMDRLHDTQRASVAIKCLLTIHSIIARGPFILQDQLSFYPSSGGRNFLNLSTFRDNSGVDMWELSSWVRWYAGFLEQNLMVSKVLGHYLCSSPRANNKEDKEDKVQAFSTSDLSRELDVLVDIAEQIGEAPDSLHLQRIALVYEVVRMVGEDYRLVQSQILLRLSELGNRAENMSYGELTRVVNALKRFEDCKERLSLLFANRKRNDGLWELIGETKMKLLMMIRKMEEMRLVMVRMGRRDDGGSESTRFRNPFAQSGKLFGSDLVLVHGWA